MCKLKTTVPRKKKRSWKMRISYFGTNRDENNFVGKNVNSGNSFKAYTHAW